MQLKRLREAQRAEAMQEEALPNELPSPSSAIFDVSSSYS